MAPLTKHNASRNVLKINPEMLKILKPKIINKVNSKFVIATFHAISGEPDYEALNEMVQKLYDNATTLPTILTGEKWSCVIMKYIMYATLVTGTPWEDPDKPGTIPTIATNSTVAHHQ